MPLRMVQRFLAERQDPQRVLMSGPSWLSGKCKTVRMGKILPGRGASAGDPRAGVTSGNRAPVPARSRAAGDRSQGRPHDVSFAHSPQDLRRLIEKRGGTLFFESRQCWTATFQAAGPSGDRAPVPARSGAGEDRSVG